VRLRVLIVDDEPPARRKLARLLKPDQRFEIVGEAEDGEKAVELIELHQPDLLFLDIQMPRMNGFEVLEALEGKRPRVIFTTAFDQYAIKAFEVRALDYLLKPIEEERFRKAVDQAAEAHSGGTDPRIDELLEEMRKRQAPLQRILIRTAGRVSFIDVGSISHIAAEDKYVRLFLEGRTLLYRGTIQALGEQLDPSVFVRVHRSHLVNIRFIRELAVLSHGDFEIVLLDGSRAPLGRTYRETLFNRLEHPPRP
jgi:two-component system LytT family response regulator